MPLAHRGLHDASTPENSLAAFAAAREAGYGVELDVQLSRDGAPVVVHDPDLRRVAGVRRRVVQLTAAELAEVRLAGTDQHVPTLEAVLAALGDTPVMVEVKNVRLRSGPLEAAVAGVLAGHAGPACVAGFNPATLRWFRRRRPQVPRVLTAGPAAALRLPGPVGRRLARLADLDAVAPAAVSYQLAGLPAAAVTRWRAEGGTVVAWTVTHPDDLARAAEVADNVIFEQVRP